MCTAHCMHGHLLLCALSVCRQRTQGPSRNTLATDSSHTNIATQHKQRACVVECVCQATVNAVQQRLTDDESAVATHKNKTRLDCSFGLLSPPDRSGNSRQQRHPVHHTPRTTYMRCTPIPCPCRLPKQLVRHAWRLCKKHLAQPAHPHAHTPMPLMQLAGVQGPNKAVACACQSRYLHTPIPPAPHKTSAALRCAGPPLPRPQLCQTAGCISWLLPLLAFRWQTDLHAPTGRHAGGVASRSLAGRWRRAACSRPCREGQPFAPPG